MTGLIILAAGESSRLGKPKQNLIFNGQTLLQLAVEAGQRSKVDKIVVVLGAHANEIKPIAETLTVYNQEWEEGMAASIRQGMKEIYKDAAVDKVIIMLCDQPFVNAELLNALIDKQAKKIKRIIACVYKETIGVPVLFDRSIFPELMELTGNDGAKKILNKYADSLSTVPFERGIIDIDTPGHYDNLQKLSD